jgi:hypothetical protein
MIDREAVSAGTGARLKIVFFAPHAALWVHAFPEALVAEALAQAGHRIVYVGCDRVFSRFCVPMRANKLDPDAPDDAKAAVCDRCERNKTLLRTRFGFDGYDIGSVLTEEDRAEADRILLEARPATFLRIVLDGVEIGRAALSTYLLTFKKSNLDFSPSEWAVFSLELRNTLYSYFACRRVLDRERPDRVMLYSSGYSVNLVWCLLAEARNIPFYYMNAGANLSDRLQKLVISRGHSLQRRLLTHWDRYRDKPSSPATLRYVTDHLVEIMKGRSPFVYSTGGALEGTAVRGYFGLEDGQKVLLATLSSYDEVFAAQVTGLFPTDFELLFPRQVDWVHACIEWVAARPELALIVRVHPREFPNKRDAVKSDHARELEAAFVDLPRNVRINWPTDNVSVYDLAKITDVGLNGWSTVGKELSLLGIPVVLYTQDLIFYPSELNLLGTDRESYFRCIDQALAEGWSIERMRRAFRWQALEDRYSRIDISDGYHYKEHQPGPLWRRAGNRLRRAVDPDAMQKLDCRRRPASLRAQPVIAALLERAADSVLDVVRPEDFDSTNVDEETTGLREQARRLYRALYGDRPSEPARDTLGGKLWRFAAG